MPLVRRRRGARVTAGSRVVEQRAPGVGLPLGTAGLTNLGLDGRHDGAGDAQFVDTQADEQPDAALVARDAATDANPPRCRRAVSMTWPTRRRTARCSPST